MEVTGPRVGSPRIRYRGKQSVLRSTRDWNQRTGTKTEAKCGIARYSCLLWPNTRFSKGVAVSVVSSALQLLSSAQGLCDTTPARLAVPASSSSSSSPRLPKINKARLPRRKSPMKKTLFLMCWTVQLALSFLPRKARTQALTSEPIDNDGMTLSVMTDIWSDGKNCKALFFAFLLGLY